MRLCVVYLYHNNNIKNKIMKDSPLVLITTIVITTILIIAIVLLIIVSIRHLKNNIKRFKIKEKTNKIRFFAFVFFNIFCLVVLLTTFIIYVINMDLSIYQGFEIFLFGFFYTFIVLMRGVKIPPLSIKKELSKELENHKL